MIDKLTAWFKSQVGVTEKNHDNNVIYNTHYYGYEVADPSGNGYAWCLAFVWDGFRTCGASSLFFNGRKSAYCPEAVNWARASGRWVTGGYKEGDIIFYDWNGDGLADHVGYVISGSPLQVIEGNYSDHVALVNRNLANVIGAYRPDYAETPANNVANAPEKPENNVAKGNNAPYNLIPPEISIGNKSPWAWALQALLRANGHNLSADGEFGVETANAVLAYQRKNNLDADGIVGIQTWTKLIGG